MNYKDAKLNLSSVYGKMVASTDSSLNDFYELESDFTVEELNQLAKEIKKKKENEKKVKEVKRKKKYPKRGHYYESKKLEFFKDCIVIKIGTRERRKTPHE